MSALLVQEGILPGVVVMYASGVGYLLTSALKVLHAQGKDYVSNIGCAIIIKVACQSYELF